VVLREGGSSERFHPDQLDARGFKLRVPVLSELAITRDERKPLKHSD
jgi:hypothetical protein